MHLEIFGAATTTADLRAAIRAAADDGFDGFWTPNIFGIDALTALAVAGHDGPEITLGTAVVPIQPRHPSALAQQALTVSQALSGRLVLGLGVSHAPVVEGMWGLPFERPASEMEEYLTALGPLLRGEDPSFAGDLVTARGALDVRDAPPPSVLVAALGTRMLGIAARLADGTVTWMTGAATVADHIVPTIRAAAEDAGRPDPRVVVALPVCVTDDAEGARGRAAELFAMYGMLPSYRAMLDREGAAGPEDVAIVGGRDEVTERLAAVFAAGATTFAASEFGTPDEVASTRALLGELNG